LIFIRLFGIIHNTNKEESAFKMDSVSNSQMRLDPISEETMQDGSSENNNTQQHSEDKEAP